MYNVFGCCRIGRRLTYLENQDQTEQIRLNQESLLQKICRAIEEGRSLEERNDEGATFLHEACQNLDQHSILLLLNKRVDVNIRDAKEQTPLHWLALKSLDDKGFFIGDSKNNDSIANLLIKEGAKLDVYDVNGNSPLHLAVTVFNIGFIASIKESHASLDILYVYNSVLNHKNIRGHTPLGVYKQLYISQDGIHNHLLQQPMAEL